VPPIAVVHSVLPWDAANVPGRGWPGRDSLASDAAFPAGQQPPSLVAWPHQEGRPAACWETSVLDSTSDGWDGQCDGLSETGDTS
ncbi:unnamed protein product, partial [Polarella glacialis]